MDTVDTIDAIECMGSIDSMNKVKKLQLENFFVIITITQKTDKNWYVQTDTNRHKWIQTDYI